MKLEKVCFRYLVFFIAALFFLATSSVFTQKETKESEPSAVAAPGEKEQAKEKTIGYLQTRDKIVTISRGAKGTQYTVKTKDGKVLASKIGEKDLEEKFPTIFNQLKHGLAGNDATLRKPTSEIPPPPRK